MPNFKIITDDGRHRIGPSDPKDLLEFEDAAAAIKDAQIGLAEIAHDNMPDGKTARFSVEVANEDGKAIYRATLRFQAWTEEQLDSEVLATASFSEQPEIGPRE